MKRLLSAGSFALAGLILSMSAASCDGEEPPGGSGGTGTGGTTDAAPDGVGGASGFAGAGTGGTSAGGSAGSAAGSAGTSGAAGSAGSAGAPDDGGGTDAPEAGDDGGPVSLVCGDAIRDPALEECDDGPGLSEDACTDTCRAHNYFVVEPILSDGGPKLGSRTLGYGRHVVAASDAGSAVAYVEKIGSTHSLWIAFFDPVGKRIAAPLDVGADAAPSEAANQVVAPLPDGKFAIAWNDLAKGSIDVAMRTASPAGLGPIVYASTGLFGYRQDPDLVWTGTDLVAVWHHPPYFDPKLRRFDKYLWAPPNSEITLGPSGTSLVVTTFAGSWATARRLVQPLGEMINVRTETFYWTVGPFVPGASLERPALIELDASTLLLVFTESTDPLQTGTASVSRLRMAILSTAAPGTASAVGVASTIEPWASDATLSQSRPALTRAGSRVYLAWQTETPVGNSLGDEVFLRELQWDGTTISFLAEIPLQADAPRLSDQRAPAITGSPLAPQGALVTVWVDSTIDPLHTIVPNLVYGLRPTPIVVLPAPGDGGA